MFKAVTGRQWAVDADNDVDPFVGRRYHLIVEDAPSGDGTRVASVVLSTEETPRSDAATVKIDADAASDDASF